MTVPDPNAGAQPQQPQTSQQPAQPAPAAGTGGQTDYQSAYTNLMAQLNDPNGPYVRREVYVGMQQTHQKEFDAHKRTQGALAESNTQLTGLQSQLQSVAQTNQTIAQQQAEAQARLQEANASLERFKLIGKEFPALIGWEAQGLLPNAPIDQLPQVLSAIAAQLQQQGQHVKQQTLEGSNVLNTSNATVITEATAAAKLSEYNAKVLEGKTPKAELDKMWKEYMELKTKETPPTLNPNAR